jgi:drug/metabolite transporter (DMT)-like permease
MGLQNFLWLLFLAALWGPSFIFIKIAGEDIPPLTLVLGRVGVAAIVLYVMLRWQGRNLPKFGPIWKHFAFLALVHNALPFALFNWGELHIDSALAAILNGTTPLFTILFAHFLIAEERITPAKIGGMLVGFGGLVMLIAPSLFDGVHATTLGLLAITIACVSYGIAIVYARLHLRGLPPLVAPTAQLLLASLYMLPLSLLLDQPFRLPLPSLAAIASVLALGVLGTAAAFVIYYMLIENTSATYVSTVTYIVPIFGVALGVLALGEQLQWNAYVGCALILVGVMIVNDVFREMLAWVRRPTAEAISRP